MNSGENFRFAASVAVRSTLLSSLSSPLSAGCTNPMPPVISSVISPPPRFEVRKRSEEHTSELQSRLHLVCRLLLEKKKKKKHHHPHTLTNYTHYPQQTPSNTTIGHTTA